jgi:2-polyprenyl-3-methyl-5-hydroxy-6-metoxy-1,4-benzoquinol methylase
VSNDTKSVRAIDISTAMIEIAQGKAATAGVFNVDFEQAAIFEEAFQNGSCDVVLAFNMALLHKWADGIHCMNPA